MQYKLKDIQNFWQSTFLVQQNQNCINGTFFLNYYEKEKEIVETNKQSADNLGSINTNQLTKKKEESFEKLENKIQDDFLDSSLSDSSLEPIKYSYLVQYLISPNEQYLVVSTKQVAFWQVSDKIIILDLKNQKLQSFTFKTDHIGAPPIIFSQDYLIIVDALYAGKPQFIFWDLINHWGKQFIITYNYPINQLIYDPYINQILILTKQNKIVRQQFNIINQNQEIQTVLNFKDGWPKNLLDCYPFQNFHFLNDSFALLINIINQVFLIKFQNQVQVIKYYYWKSIQSEVVKIPQNNSLAVIGNEFEEIPPQLIDFRRGKLIRKAPKLGTNGYLYSYQGSCFLSSIEENKNLEKNQSNGIIFDILRGNIKYRKLMDQKQLEYTKIKFTHNLIAQYCNDKINYNLIY
ncbi:unnamed protein product [Paramecium sonneborni]|uniref:Uncharacterized protein n=1 Tax=Paramecium sonneborni TaxID=65129 RepID=A0A8S1N2N4_9CILI|nr:unnamed protein product [Paramecium sonneborni]